ncbi:unnamed protein product, partial [Tuber aestivum]
VRLALEKGFREVHIAIQKTHVEIEKTHVEIEKIHTLVQPFLWQVGFLFAGATLFGGYIGKEYLEEKYFTRPPSETTDSPGAGPTVTPDPAVAEGRPLLK